MKDTYVPYKQNEQKNYASSAECTMSLVLSISMQSISMHSKGRINFYKLSNNFY